MTPKTRASTVTCDHHEDNTQLLGLTLFLGNPKSWIELRLFGCNTCRLAWPYPREEYPHLSPTQQAELHALAARKGYGWDEQRAPR